MSTETNRTTFRRLVDELINNKNPQPKEEPVSFLVAGISRTTTITHQEQEDI